MMEKKKNSPDLFGLHAMYGLMMPKAFYFKIYIDLKNWKFECFAKEKKNFILIKYYLITYQVFLDLMLWYFKHHRLRWNCLMLATKFRSHASNFS